MRRIIGVLVLVPLLAAGCADRSKPGSTGPGESVVEVTMRDNTYNPEMITVPNGRRVVLRFVNRGSVEHEAIIGDQAAQDDHADEMRSATSVSSEDMGGMGEMSHAPGDRAVTVKPGATAEIVTIFDSAGTFIIGCHQPGHYESGMKASLSVA